MSKFVYEEGELQCADSQCEFCQFYFDGTYSKECPKEHFEEIVKNQIDCPVFTKKVMIQL